MMEITAQSMGYLKLLQRVTIVQNGARKLEAG